MSSNFHNRKVAVPGTGVMGAHPGNSRVETRLSDLPVAGTSEPCRRMPDLHANRYRLPAGVWA